ncbi:unnamed protein product [Blepharisma stoltei]|uniref:Glutaredoxin domain-containing protein n=1 Tax=Blepharisma stoltei TaxID=1481888 RepID=A0AAU9JXN5_9CILI|nr:unnamed protein product [Blepharisma stoltei]
MGIRQSAQCPVKPEVLETVKLHSVVIYSRHLDPSSFKAENLLRRIGVDPYVIEVEFEENQRMIMRALFQMTGQVTLPIIFIGGKFVGSTLELSKGIKSGYIQILLKRNNVEITESEESDEDNQ